MPTGTASLALEAGQFSTAPAGAAPAAILLGEPDLILSIGAAVAEELYGRAVPVVPLSVERLGAIRDGASVRLHHTGRIEVG